MRIIISPAKQMRVDMDTFTCTEVPTACSYRYCRRRDGENTMKKKLIFYKCTIIVVICFSITVSLQCIAENSCGTEGYTIPDSFVLDTGDADSVRLMVDALEDMRKECQAAVSAEDDEEENQPGEERPGVLDELQEGEWITLDQAVCVRVPADERTRVYVLMSMETDGSAIWQSGVNAEDSFETCWYLSKGQLLGCQSGIKDGGIHFAGILPQWKEERLGETQPLSGNGYIEEGWRVFSYAEESDTARYYQERAVSILDPEVPGPLKSADTRLEEMAEQMDLEDAAAVASYIRGLDWMRFILQKEIYESVPEIELEERIVSPPINTDGSALAYKTRDGRGGVIWKCAGDAYSKYFIFDKELIGLQTGVSFGQFTYAAQLPQWKDDETSMDVPLVGDEPRFESQEEKISWESARQKYPDIIEEIWPDRS